LKKDAHTHFVSLFVRHQQELHRYILTLLPNPTAAEDVLQDTAMAIWEKFDEYDESAPFMPWAIKFAYYKVLSFRKTERKHRHLDDDVLALIAHEQPDGETMRAQRLALNHCLEQLSAHERKLVEYRYERKESISSLADMMQCSANVLYKALGRIRRTLIKCVKHRVKRETHHE